MKGFNSGEVNDVLLRGTMEDSLLAEFDLVKVEKAVILMRFGRLSGIDESQLRYLPSFHPGASITRD